MTAPHGSEGLLWNQDGVDDVDDAVARGDIGLHDIRTTGLHLTGIGLDGELFAIYGLGITRHNVLGHYFAWNNVVGQHGDQFLLVFWFEQVLDRAVRELGKGFVGGRKNGEGPLAVQGIHESRQPSLRRRGC